MSLVTWREYLPIGVPLALAACSRNTDKQAQPESQGASANQKSDQALSTAQAQDANAPANQQFQRSLQK
jgi:hypothetical protein